MFLHVRMTEQFLMQWPGQQVFCLFCRHRSSENGHFSPCSRRFFHYVLSTCTRRHGFLENDAGRLFGNDFDLLGLWIQRLGWEFLWWRRKCLLFIFHDFDLIARLWIHRLGREFLWGRRKCLFFIFLMLLLVDNRSLPRQHSFRFPRQRGRHGLVASALGLPVGHHGSHVRFSCSVYRPQKKEQREGRNESPSCTVLHELCHVPHAAHAKTATWELWTTVCWTAHHTVAADRLAVVLIIVIEEDRSPPNCTQQIQPVGVTASSFPFGVRISTYSRL